MFCCALQFWMQVAFLFYAGGVSLESVSNICRKASVQNATNEFAIASFTLQTTRGRENFHSPYHLRF